MAKLTKFIYLAVVIALLGLSALTSVQGAVTTAPENELQENTKPENENPLKNNGEGTGEVTEKVENTVTEANGNVNEDEEGNLRGGKKAVQNGAKIQTIGKTAVLTPDQDLHVLCGEGSLDQTCCVRLPDKSVIYKSEVAEQIEETENSKKEDPKKEDPKKEAGKIDMNGPESNKAKLVPETVETTGKEDIYEDGRRFTIEAVDPQHKDQVAAHIYERALGQCNTGLQQAGCEAYNDGNQPNAPGGVYACVKIVGGELDSGEGDLPMENLVNANEQINKGDGDGVFVEHSQQHKEKQHGELNNELEHGNQQKKHNELELSNEVHENQQKKHNELELSNELHENQQKKHDEETTESP